MNEVRRFLGIVMMLFSTLTIAQQKFEKEARLAINKVPKKALEFLEGVEIKKIKWYLEESLEGQSIEAKFKLKTKKYSVEFDTQGDLQDIEVTYDLESLREEEKRSIKKGLAASYKKYKLKKIQKQYAATINSLVAFENAKEDNSICYYEYEIVVKAKKDSKWNLYEVIIDTTGNIKKEVEIIFRNTDNLEY